MHLKIRENSDLAPFLKILANVKKILRLSHLYTSTTHYEFNIGHGKTKKLNAKLYISKESNGEKLLDGSSSLMKNGHFRAKTQCLTCAS